MYIFEIFDNSIDRNILFLRRYLFEGVKSLVSQKVYVDIFVTNYCLSCIKVALNGSFFSHER